MHSLNLLEESSDFGLTSTGSKDMGLLLLIYLLFVSILHACLLVRIFHVGSTFLILHKK